MRFGIALLLVGLVFSAVAYFWRSPALLETNGTIVSSSVAPQRGPHVQYEYSVQGKRYVGEGYVRRPYIRYASQYDSSLSVGAPVPVYFERRNPAVSYIIRPSRLPLIISGVIFGAIGALITALTWTR